MHEAAKSGIDIFRIFDAFNNVDQMRPAIEAVLETDKVAEGTLCYSGDLANPDRAALHARLLPAHSPKQLVETGCHVLCVKDMAGLLRAPAANAAHRCAARAVDLPVHLHTHDTGGRPTRHLPRSQSKRALTRRGAAGPLSGTPRVSRRSRRSSPQQITPSARRTLAQGAEQPRAYGRRCENSTHPLRADSRRRPGACIARDSRRATLQPRHKPSRSVLGDRFEIVEDLYAAADRILGRIVKVTPSSKVVGDLALYLCGIDADPNAFEKDPARVRHSR